MMNSVEYVFNEWSYYSNTKFEAEDFSRPLVKRHC